MLSELADEMERKISRSIDFIETPEAKNAIRASLPAVREFMGAIIAEVHNLDNQEIPREDNTQGMKTIRVFKRFEYDIDARLTETSRYATAEKKRRSKSNEEDAYYHDPLNHKGYWQWVYKYHLSVWIANAEKQRLETLSGGKKAVKNCVQPLPDKARYMDEECNPEKIPYDDYHKLDTETNTKSLIVIPFEHKIENSDGVWGFLDIEFDHNTTYSAEQYDALKKLSRNIATIIWKANAWRLNKEGTEGAVKEFEKYCENTNSLSIKTKTALFIQNSRQSGNIKNIFKDACAKNHVMLNEFCLGNETPGLYSTHPLNMSDFLKGHFAIFDISSYPSDPEVLFLLGIAVTMKKPCCIIQQKENKNAKDQIPDAIKTVLEVSKSGILRLYFYEENCDDIGENGGRNTTKTSFFDKDSEFIEDWRSEWEEFIESVKKSSPSYGVACNWPSMD